MLPLGDRIAAHIDDRRKNSLAHPGLSPDSSDISRRQDFRLLWEYLVHSTELTQISRYIMHDLRRFSHSLHSGSFDLQSYGPSIREIYQRATGVTSSSPWALIEARVTSTPSVFPLGNLCKYTETI